MSDDRVSVTVRVQPGARRAGFVGVVDGVLKLAVTAPPVDGAANAAAVRALAAELGVRPRAVTLVGGERSRLKRFAIDGLSASEVEQRLASVRAACSPPSGHAEPG